jgi:hypothetical protein
MEHEIGRDSKLICIILCERTAALSECCQIEAGLRIGGVLIVDGKQAVTLRTYITDLQKDIAGQFALNREVVLRGILGAQFCGELAEKQNRAVE